MGQRAHPARARKGWVPALVASVVAAATVTLSGCTSSVASAPTVLERADQVSVVHSDGSTVDGVSGQRLRRGDVVRTGPSGRADLVTRARIVHVGSDASVRIANGARQELRHGAVVVDAQHGPGLELQAAGVTVTTPSGSAVRAERAVTVRVGTLAGSARLSSDTGRVLALPSLFQVVIGGDALPDSPSALRLTDDDGEARAVPQLVSDDESLSSLAAGIDAAGTSTTRLVTVSWNRPVDAVPAGMGGSEQVLPIVIASAAGGARETADYRKAVLWRKQGGSWGVVAHLLGVRAGSVVDVLAVLERSQPPGVVGSIPAVFAALNRAALLSGRRPNGAARPGGSSGSGRGAGGSPAPRPSPTDLVRSARDTVSATVAQVLAILPTPTPPPTSSPLTPGVARSLPTSLVR